MSYQLNSINKSESVSRLYKVRRRLVDEELKGARARCRSASSSPLTVSATLKQWFLQVWFEIKAATVVNDAPPRMCENYGHTAQKTWKCAFPHCTDCGKKILSLLFAMETEATGAEMPAA